MGMGALHVLDGTISPGTLLVVMAYLGYVYGPMTAIATTSGSIQQALAGARRVRRTLALQRERDGSETLDRSRMCGAVRFEHVRCGYDAPGGTLRLIGWPGFQRQRLYPSGNSHS